jgi:hypothetical protein
MVRGQPENQPFRTLRTGEDGKGSEATPAGFRLRKVYGIHPVLGISQSTSRGRDQWEGGMQRQKAKALLSPMDWP